MMWYWGSGVHEWAWGLGIFTSIIFWGLIIWAIVALVSWSRRDRPSGPGGPGLGPWPQNGPSRENGPWPGEGPWRDGDAEQILARRFAAGEIDAEEYRQRLEVLHGQRHRPSATGAPSGQPR